MGVINLSIGIITKIELNRPEKHNAINPDMLNALSSAINKASENIETKAVIITGAGSKAFSAGADLEYLYSLKDETLAKEAFDLFYNSYKAVWECKKPVIAAINGYCLGGGNELAIACDFRVASEDSTFGQPEVKLGIIPGGGATYRLGLIIGMQNARRMILTGENLDAHKAFEMGLADNITKGNAIEYAMEFAEKLCLESSGYAKRAINFAVKPDYLEEKRMFVKSLLSPAARESILKFIKRER